MAKKIAITLTFDLDEKMLAWLQDFDTGYPISEWTESEIKETLLESLDLIVEESVPCEKSAEII